jgi:uncharacterized protein (AIM24 family)
VEAELDPEETVIGETGGYMIMGEGIAMQIIFGDRSQQQGSGLLDGLMTAGRPVLAGENLFMTAFTNIGQDPQMGNRREEGSILGGLGSLPGGDQ